MIKASLLLSILATVLTLPLNAQVVNVFVPENGKNCSAYSMQDNTPWAPPGEPTSAEHFIWDSGDWLRASYSYYEYNLDGTVSILVLADKDNILKHRWEYTYDAQGNMTEEVLYDFSPGSTPWIPKYRSMYTFDAQGRNIEKIRQHYGFGQWYNHDRRNRSFEANNFQTLDLSRVWNSQTNSWDTTYAERIHFAYDANGYPQESYWKYKANGSWQNVDFRKYVLDLNNEITEIQIDGWNGSSYQPQQLIKNIIWRYNAIPEREYAEYYNYNGSGYSPALSYHSLQGQCLKSYTDTFRIWDGSIFTPLSTTFADYDASGTNLELSYSELDTNTGVWQPIPFQLGIPTFDGSGAIQQYIRQEADSAGVLQNYSMSIYGYATGIEGNDEVSQFNVYPSPANDVLNLDFGNVELAHVQLYSATGKLIDDLSTTQRQIQTADLPNGIYLIVASTANKNRLQKKFVVQH